MEVERESIGGKPVEIYLMMYKFRWVIAMTALPFNPYLSLHKDAIGFSTRILAFTQRQRTPVLNVIFTQNWSLYVKGFQVPEELDNGELARVHNKEDGKRILLEVFNTHLKEHGLLGLVRRCAATGEFSTVPFIAAEGMSDMEWHHYPKIPDSVALWSGNLLEDSSIAMISKDKSKSKDSLALARAFFAVALRRGRRLEPYALSKFIKEENDRCTKLRSDCKFRNFLENTNCKVDFGIDPDTGPRSTFDVGKNYVLPAMRTCCTFQFLAKRVRVTQRKQRALRHMQCIEAKNPAAPRFVRLSAHPKKFAIRPKFSCYFRQAPRTVKLINEKLRRDFWKVWFKMVFENLPGVASIPLSGPFQKKLHSIVAEESSRKVDENLLNQVAELKANLTFCDVKKFSKRRFTEMGSSLEPFLLKR